MVNGNYVLYGDRPSSESETVDDHVQTRTAERKVKRKSNRTSKESHHNHKNEIDNETDAVKYEKKIKEPRLLRYVPTTDVEENYITEKFETYDLKPTEDLPKRHVFTKKAKNPADGSVNYAYSRSSSSCSSPNLPTISEHGEQYGTYRVRSSQTPPDNNPIGGYESKLDKYFAKPREVKAFSAKGSHPDSLYRVPSDSGTNTDRFMRVLRILRWPLALFTVCVALAVFVYFLMPVNLDSESDTVNATYWEESISEAQSHHITDNLHNKPSQNKGTEKSRPRGTKTPEIDFYDDDTGKNYDLTTLIDIITERSQKRKLPIAPVFPIHISPEVQYGNERVDSEKLRSPKLLKSETTELSDSTLKPHITQKPEKPLAIYFKDGNGVTTTSTESVPMIENFANAETSNDITSYLKQYNKKTDTVPNKSEMQINKDPTEPSRAMYENTKYIKQTFSAEPRIPPEFQEFYDRPVINNDIKFTSGHSNLFGLSIEDAANMKSTTQNSLYNTRVSPTLPTWRSRDDATTKKYPISGNFDVPQCRSTRVPLCRGVLPYDLASVPATVGEIDVTTLLPQIEYLVSTNCSQRVRHFACALLEPECSPPPYSPKLPCYSFCKAIVDHCESMIPSELQAMFSCSQYSSSNCASARIPCYSRELACGDGTCVPRDWVCDGTRDCPGGEDEAPCSTCEENEYRCSSGMCITSRWLCDGYADCASGEDERKELCQGRGVMRVGPANEDDIDEPGEESAGSAPAPSIRKPNRLPVGHERSYRIGENDNSKELLMTSDSNNAYRRNFTRRPSPSRLTPYKRPKPLDVRPDTDERIEILKITSKLNTTSDTTIKTDKPILKDDVGKETGNIQDSGEDVNIGDLGFFEDIEKEKNNEKEKNEKVETKVPRQNLRKQTNRLKPTELPPGDPMPTRLDKTLNKLERVIDGASMLRKAARENQEETIDSPESNSTLTADKTEEISSSGYNSAHASPCPSGELRCVDGRCITLSQLCDGTIDCTDHADEDNCYT